MAEGDVTFLNHWKEQLLIGGADMNGDTFKIVLGNTYVITADGNLGYADISGNEISGSGYTAGGETLASLAAAQVDGSDYATWDADNVTWSSLAANTITWAAIYDDTITTPVADPLVCFIEIGTNSNGGDYSVNFNATGIATLA